MKFILIIAVVLTLISCGDAAPSPSQTELAATTQSAPIASTSQSDANSGATNVAAPLMLNGTLTIPAQNNVTISLPISGIIASFNLLPGTYVSKGQTIAVLENTEFIDIQQSYLDAAAQTEFLEAEYNRQRTLAEQDVTSQKRLEQSKSEFLSAQSRKQATAAKLSILKVKASDLAKNGIVEKLIVEAPSSGYVSDIMVNQGKFVAAGESICQIINKSQILLSLIAYEKDLRSIKIGQKIEFNANGIDHEVFSATITAIDEQVDPVNRSVKVYAKASGSHPNFRPGMYVIAKI